MSSHDDIFAHVYCSNADTKFFQICPVTSRIVTEEKLLL